MIRAFRTQSGLTRELEVKDMDIPEGAWIEMTAPTREEAEKIGRGIPQYHSLRFVQKKGLEPSRYCYHTDLNRARLPIPPFLLAVIV